VAARNTQPLLRLRQHLMLLLFLPVLARLRQQHLQQRVHVCWQKHLGRFLLLLQLMVCAGAVG
jgi:hypothetical protein